MTKDKNYTYDTDVFFKICPQNLCRNRPKPNIPRLLFSAVDSPIVHLLASAVHNLSTYDAYVRSSCVDTHFSLQNILQLLSLAWAKSLCIDMYLSIKHCDIDAKLKTCMPVYPCMLAWNDSQNNKNLFLLAP